MPSADDLRRLAIAVADRRKRLRLTKEAAARRADLNTITWNRVENALPVRDVTYASVEDALEWPAGTIERVLNGDQPQEDETPASLPSVTYTEVQRGDLRVLLAALGDADDATQQAMIDQALAAYREHKRNR